jgi:phosphoglucosamine mutase
VVGTVMSNLGLERALEKHDIEFRRARVGDRYVLETLSETGGIIGGETSGHVICLDRTTTGDGLVVALQVLAVMRRTGKALSELAGGMAKFPQTMLNVRTEKNLDPSKSPKIQEAINQIEGELSDSGRVVLRASGTEPVIRVMVEGENEDQVIHLARKLAAVVAEAAS